MVFPLISLVVAGAAVASCFSKEEDSPESGPPQGPADLTVRLRTAELFGSQVATAEVCEAISGKEFCSRLSGEAQGILEDQEAELRRVIAGERAGPMPPFVRFVAHSHQECLRKTGYVRYAPEDSFTCITPNTVITQSAHLCVGDQERAYCSGELPKGLAQALDAADTDLFLKMNPNATGWFRGAGLR